jgi:hypothetical protein
LVDAPRPPRHEGYGDYGMDDEYGGPPDEQGFAADADDEEDA